jgi:cytochrome c556
MVPDYTVGQGFPYNALQQKEGVRPMGEPMKTTRRMPATAAALLLVATFAVVSAQQPAGRGATPVPGPGAAAPAPAPARPLVPVVASTVAANPDAYYGETVTMTASVDQIFSRTVFSLDQDPTKSTGQDVLVLVPTLQGPVDLNAYVTVFGEVVKFDPAEIARKVKDYKLDLPADVAAKYRDRPAVIATTVLNAKMVDLAKRLPPPMTADEEALSKVMKRVAPAFAALRQAADGSNADGATQNAVILKQSFTETEAFWKAKARADAMKWAQIARLQAESIVRDAATGKWDAVKASAGTLGQQCQACHTTYRERFDDGSYRIKMGTR